MILLYMGDYGVSVENTYCSNEGLGLGSRVHGLACADGTLKPPLDVTNSGKPKT